MAELTQTITHLQQENNRLHQLLENQPTQNTAPIIQAAVIPNETQDQLQNQLQQLEMEKQLRIANDFNNRIMQAQHNNPHFNLNDALAQGFKNEQRDPQWADEQENTYRNLFNDTAELADFALRNSQCKKNQCELTVSINSIEQSDQLLEEMKKALAANNKQAVIVIAPDAQAGISRLYLSDDATSFEFN